MARRSSHQRRSPEDRLRHFAAVVERCFERRAVVDQTLRARLRITATVEQPAVELQTDHGDQEDVRSFAAEFRKLLLNDDDANFNAICNLIEQRSTDDEMRGYSRSNREQWSQLMAGAGGIKLVVNQRPAKRGRELLDVWLNGEVFHSDPEAAAYLTEVERGEVGPMARALLVQEVQSTLITGLKIAAAQRRVVMHLLDNQLLTLTDG